MSSKTRKPPTKRKKGSRAAKSTSIEINPISAKPKHSKKHKKRKNKRGIRGFLIISSLILLVLGIGFFYFVDSLVEKRLASGESSEGSKVLSDAEYFRQGQKISLDYLRTSLLQRNYSSVQSHSDSNLSPDLVKLEVNSLKPGEFSDSGQSIKITTRPFLDSAGTEVNSANVVISSSSSEDFALEPIPLATLGGQETRASRFIPITKIPKHLIDAVIAIEDERFYQHFGVDPIGILRALVTNILKAKLAQGGSTITQQLAKNLFFSPQRSIKRKLLEIPAALSLEHRLSKQQILELYLNEVYLGQDGAIAIHGMGEASREFFGKDISRLEPAESALLAGLIQAPSLYAPKRFPDRAIKRRDIVLDKMCELHFLETTQCEQAKASPLKVIPNTAYKPKIPYYLNALQENLGDRINLDAAIHQGLNVRTGIQSDIQECAEVAIQTGINKLEKTHPSLVRNGKPLEAALVAIEPFSGKIKAWVGGRDFQLSQFDRVSKAKRQIGSTVKPFVYLTALDSSLNTYKTATAISILSDRPMELELNGNKSWNPENYDHEYRGDVTLRYALEHSLNVPAVYISQKFGVKSLAKVIEQFHVQENPQNLPAIALGALDTSLLRLTAAYAALANGGIYVKPRLFISAQDSDGKILDSTPLEETQVANEGAVFVLTSILQGVVERGTATSVRKSGYKGPAAGKTGTTNDARDAWFVGYTPELSVGVWLGFDDNKKIGLTGGVAAAPIWGDFMSCVSKNHSLLDFVPPTSVSLVEVEPQSGLKVTKDCPGVQSVSEYFVKGTEPKDFCGTEKESPKEPETPSEDDAPRREHSLWDNLFG